MAKKKQSTRKGKSNAPAPASDSPRRTWRMIGWTLLAATWVAVVLALVSYDPRRLAEPCGRDP